MKRLSRYAVFAWGVLAFNLVVVLWGAYVRASGSGAGCGQHWPMCNGEVIPRSPAVATLIELTHRVTSGLALVLVVALAVGSRFAAPAGSPLRRSAGAALGFMIVEALLGAMLVLLRLVDHDASSLRAFSVAAHLDNTLLLLGSLGLTAAFASGLPSPRSRGNGALLGLLGPAAVGLMVLGASGAVAALGDTLFPARSLAEGFAQDVSPEAHLFLRLRTIHPLVAVVTSGYLLVVTPTIRALRSDPRVRALSFALTGAVLVQVALGLANVALLAPMALQLAHLFVADAVWLLLVLFGASALGSAPGDVIDAARTAAPRVA